MLLIQPNSESFAITVGGHQLPSRKRVAGFLVDKAPPQVQLLAEVKALSDTRHLRTVMNTEVHDASRYAGKVNLKLDISAFRRENTDSVMSMGLYTVQTNYFTQLECCCSNIPINAPHLLPYADTFPSDYVAIESEPRFPFQHFYSALLFSSKNSDTLYLTKHVIGYNFRSKLGEVIYKLLIISDIARHRLGVSVASEFIKEVIKSPRYIQPMLVKYLAKNTDNPKAHKTNPIFDYARVYEGFKAKLDYRSDTEAFPMFLEQLCSWFDLQ